MIIRIALNGLGKVLDGFLPFLGLEGIISFGLQFGSFIEV
jgi:hypothetical protein